MMHARVMISTARIGQCRPALSVWSRFKATATSSQEVEEAVSIKPFSDIPGPKGLPLVGTIFETIKNSSRMNEMIKERHERYGPIYREKLGNMEFLFLTDVEAVSQLLRQDGKYPARKQLDHWLKYRDDRGLSKGLFMSDGEAWHSLRRVVDKHMLKVKVVETYAGAFNGTVSEFLERLDRIRTSDHEIPKLDEELFNWSLESIARILYEKRLGCLSDNKSEDTQAFIQCIHDLFEASSKMFMLPPYLARILMPKTYKKHDDAWDTFFRVAFKTVDERIREIKETAAKGEHVGFVTHFLNEDVMSMKDVYANITELMGGAVDTTSNTALMALYEISRNKAVQDAMYEEINRVVPPGEQPVAEHLREMHYTKAVIKETLRMYPIASVIVRKVQQDAVLLGYEVPKGKYVWIDMYGIGRLKRHYYDPDTFRPERWLRESRTTKPHPFAWLPFGFGSRMCVGRRVAEMELQLLLSQLVRQFHLDPVSMDPVQLKTDFLLLPKNPIRIRAHERK